MVCFIVCMWYVSESARANTSSTGIYVHVRCGYVYYCNKRMALFDSSVVLMFSHETYQLANGSLMVSQFPFLSLQFRFFANLCFRSQDLYFSLSLFTIVVLIIIVISFVVIFSTLHLYPHTHTHTVRKSMHRMLIQALLLDSFSPSVGVSCDKLLPFARLHPFNHETAFCMGIFLHHFAIPTHIPPTRRRITR